MVKHTIILLSMLTISCSIKTKLLENQITDVPVDNAIFKKKIFFNDNILNKIDTDGIYQEQYSYLSDENNFKNINSNMEYQSSSFRGYYKFYPNGCLNFFSFKDYNEITTKTINPSFNGQRGVLYTNENKIKIDLFTIKGYSFKKDYGILTHIVEIKGDTLFDKREIDPTRVTVYVKKKLSENFNIYKPDW